MKNKIIIIIFILIFILLIGIIFFGVEFGKVRILSIKEMQEKNNQLHEKIASASNVTSVEYPAKTDSLEATYEQYKIEKQKYEEMSGFTNSKKKKVYEVKQYDIGYLWQLIGKYARTYNLAITMNVNQSSTPELCELHFNINGEYVNISRFIAEVENNSDLYFRIYNFNMNGGGDQVYAYFLVKDIKFEQSTVVSGENMNF